MKKQYGTHKQRRWEDGKMSAIILAQEEHDPQVLVVMVVNTWAKSIPNIQLILMQTNICVILTSTGEEILTGIEFREQADDYYWSPYFINTCKLHLICVFKLSFSKLFFPLSLSFLHL